MKLPEKAKNATVIITVAFCLGLLLLALWGITRGPAPPAPPTPPSCYSAAGQIDTRMFLKVYRDSATKVEGAANTVVCSVDVLTLAGEESRVYMELFQDRLGDWYVRATDIRTP